MQTRQTWLLAIRCLAWVLRLIGGDPWRHSRGRGEGQEVAPEVVPSGPVDHRASLGRRKGSEDRVVVRVGGGDCDMVNAPVHTLRGGAAGR